MLELISKLDVLQGNKRIVGIAIIAVVAGLRLLDINVVDADVMNLINAVGVVVAVFGAVMAKIRK